MKTWLPTMLLIIVCCAGLIFWPRGPQPSHYIRRGVSCFEADVVKASRIEADSLVLRGSDGHQIIVMPKQDSSTSAQINRTCRFR